jgi:diguanylate cyclase (GGDEF)-like protein
VKRILAALFSHIKRKSAWLVALAKFKITISTKVVGLIILGLVSSLIIGIMATNQINNIIVKMNDVSYVYNPLSEYAMNIEKSILLQQSSIMKAIAYSDKNSYKKEFDENNANLYAALSDATKLVNTKISNAESTAERRQFEIYKSLLNDINYKQSQFIKTVGLQVFGNSQNTPTIDRLNFVEIEAKVAREQCNTLVKNITSANQGAVEDVNIIKTYARKVVVITLFTSTLLLILLGTIILLKDIKEHRKTVEEITQLNNKLKDLANKDGLTRAYNRYFFDDRLQHEIDRVIKQKTFGQLIYQDVDNFGLIIFDIDYFKTYNDNNGHLAGDELLKELVSVVRSVLFPTDLLCRYGGEEFTIICCKTSGKGIAIVAEKVRAAVEGHKFKFQENQPNGNLTISVGTSYCYTDGLTAEELIEKADKRLYMAKLEGRNKVVVKG